MNKSIDVFGNNAAKSFFGTILTPPTQTPSTPHSPDKSKVVVVVVDLQKKYS